MKRIDHRILLAAITLVGFALRVIRLDLQPLWWDEGYSLFFATRDFGTMLERTAVDIHPPLYYALLQLWMTFAGKSDVAVRLLSVTIGVAAIPLLCALAHRLFADTRIALIAALLLALSPLHIYYSQEVRMYGLVTLLGLGSVYLFVRLLQMPPGKLKTAIVATAYVLVTAAALYTQYYAAFVVAFEILVLAILAFRHVPPPHRFPVRSAQGLRASRATVVTRQLLVHWFIAFLAILVLYLPWVAYASGKLYTYVSAKQAIEQYTPLDPITFLAQHLAAFSVGHLTAWTWLAWGSVVLVMLALWGIASTGRGGTRETGRQREEEQASHPVTLSPYLLIFLYLLVPLALGYIVNLIYPFHPIRNERLLLIAAPAFLILVALGIHALRNYRALWGALAVVAVLSAASLYDFYSIPRYPNDDYRPLFTEIQMLAQPGDTFLAVYPWQMGYLEAYYAGAPLDITETPSGAWNSNLELMQRDLDALRATHSRTWFAALQTQGHILEDKLEAYLRPRDYAVVDDWFGTTRLEMYDAMPDPPPSGRPLPNTLSKLGLEAKSWGISEKPIAAGQDILSLWFDWRSLPGANPKLSLRLIDSNGNLWAQDDRVIEPGVQRIGLAVPAGTPPGEYDLRAIAYGDQEQGGLNNSLARVHVIAPSHANLAAIPHRVSADLNNGVRLAGYDIGADAIRPGEPAAIVLYWQTTRPLDADYAVELQVQDSRGNTYGRAQAAPALGIYPTTRWRANDLVRDPQSFILRGDTPDGEYRIVATMVNTTNNVRTSAVTVREVTVKNRQHYFAAPSPSQKTDASLGDFARLVGYDLNSDRGNVRLALYWQALSSTSASYKVFVHIVDANGNIVAQDDQFPGGGTLPTTSWITNEYLVDLHEFSIPVDSPSGEYQIQVGLYDPKTGARLPAFNAANQNAGDYIQLPTRITVP